MNRMYIFTLRRVNFLVFDENFSLDQLRTRQRNVTRQLYSEANTQPTLTDSFVISVLCSIVILLKIR